MEKNTEVELKNNYGNLDANGKKAVQMYISARQFKNAILEEEIIIMPEKALQAFNINQPCKIDFEGIKITFRGNKEMLRMYPFIVNKAFACEIYIKLILKYIDFDNIDLKRTHSLFKLYKKTKDSLKTEILKYFSERFDSNIDNKLIEKEIKEISNAFIKWRYIYENIDEKVMINYGFLDKFCEFLDEYTAKKIKEKYNYNVEKDMR